MANVRDSVSAHSRAIERAVGLATYLGSIVGIHLDQLDLAKHIHTADQLAEHRVLAIQVCC